MDKRRKQLLEDLKDRVEKTCRDRQIVERIGPKNGQRVKIVERFMCHLPKDHKGDHQDTVNCTGWPQNTVSPSTIIWGQSQ